MGCSASRMKGELHPTKNHMPGGLWHLVQIFLHIGWQCGMGSFDSGVAREGGGGGHAMLYDQRILDLKINEKRQQ